MITDATTTPATPSTTTAIDRTTDAVLDLETIVVGVDDRPEHVLAWVGRQRIDTAHLVHAISPAVELLEAGFQVDVGHQVDAANERLAELAGAMHRFVPRVGCHVVEESTTLALVRAAESTEAGAIVVGSGRRRGPGTLVGPEVGRLIHRSEVPVIVLPDLAGTDESAPGEADEGPHVVVAVDEFADAPDLLAWVAESVAPGASVDVLAAVSPTVLAVADTPDAMAGIEHVLRQRLTDVLPHGFDGRAEVRFERPIEAYAEASTQASLLVLASRRRRRLEGVLTGSVVHHLPTISSCPIALVPLPEH